MASKRVHISLPDDLLFEIDEIVGPRGRSAFLIETARAVGKRRKLLAFLESGEAAWKDEDDPKLAKGSAEWVRRLRLESEAHLKRKEKEVSRSGALELYSWK